MAATPKTHHPLCPVLSGPCHSVGGADRYHDVTPVGGTCSCGQECQCALISKIVAFTKENPDV